MTRPKGTRPEQYAGVFQSYEEIPNKYRLETFTTEYRNEATWDNYVTEVLYGEQDSPSKALRKTVRLAGDSWQDHMEEQNRHHALATPSNVETWTQKLTSNGWTRKTCYEHYFVRIYQFYDYLRSSYRHPHLYNPALLAAIEYETTRNLWMYRVDTRPEVNTRE